MPWSGGPVNDRIELMKMWESGRYTVVELAERAGVSRQCLHKWLRRWREGREGGMEELSRAPLNPRRVDSELIKQLIKLKEENPEYGPEKLVTV